MKKEEQRIKYVYVGFLVLTAVGMKISIFWNITQRSPLSIGRRFGGTYRHTVVCRRMVRKELAYTSVMHSQGKDLMMAHISLRQM
jgi:hypothetical protein